jgi:hypothetical protein
LGLLNLHDIAIDFLSWVITFYNLIFCLEILLQLKY